MESAMATEPKLRWSGGWRKVYGTAAKDLGYRCSWDGGWLLISRETGEKIAVVRPKTSEFRMKTLVRQALNRRILENRRKRKLQDDRFLHSETLYPTRNCAPDWRAGGRGEGY